LKMRAANAEKQDEMRIEAASELADRRALLMRQVRELEARRAAQ
jgi:hypothetical protein